MAPSTLPQPPPVSMLRGMDDLLSQSLQVIAELVAPHWSRAVRLAVGTALGLLIIPLSCFCVAWVLGTSIRWPLVLAVATAFNLGAGIPCWMLRRGAPAEPAP